MDVTHWNIGPPMGEFWMLQIITSAHESVHSVLIEVLLQLATLMLFGLYCIIFVLLIFLLHFIFSGNDYFMILIRFVLNQNWSTGCVAAVKNVCSLWFNIYFFCNNFFVYFSFKFSSSMNKIAMCSVNIYFLWGIFVIFWYYGHIASSLTLI